MTRYKSHYILVWLIGGILYFCLMLVIRCVCTLCELAVLPGVVHFSIIESAEIIGLYVLTQMVIAWRNRRFGWIMPLIILCFQYLMIGDFVGEDIPYATLHELCPPSILVVELFNHTHSVLSQLIYGTVLCFFATIILFVYLYLLHLLVHAILDKIFLHLMESSKIFFRQFAIVDAAMRKPSKAINRWLNAAPVAIVMLTVFLGFTPDGHGAFLKLYQLHKDAVLCPGVIVSKQRRTIDAREILTYAYEYDGKHYLGEVVHSWANPNVGDTIILYVSPSAPDLSILCDMYP